MVEPIIEPLGRSAHSALQTSIWNRLGSVYGFRRRISRFIRLFLPLPELPLPPLRYESPTDFTMMPKRLCDTLYRAFGHAVIRGIHENQPIPV